MAQLEELLEKKPDAVSEDMGYSTPSDAYPEDEWEKQKLKGLASPDPCVRDAAEPRSTVAQRLGCVRWKSRTGRWRSRFSAWKKNWRAWRHGRRRSWGELRLKWTPCGRDQPSAAVHPAEQQCAGPHSAAAGTGKRRERKRFPGIVIDTEQRRQALQKWCLPPFSSVNTL